MISVPPIILSVKHIPFLPRVFYRYNTHHYKILINYLLVDLEKSQIKQRYFFHYYYYVFIFLYVFIDCIRMTCSKSDVTR